VQHVAHFADETVVHYDYVSPRKNCEEEGGRIENQEVPDASCAASDQQVLLLLVQVHWDLAAEVGVATRVELVCDRGGSGSGSGSGTGSGLGSSGVFRGRRSAASSLIASVSSSAASKQKH